mgnify:FL=1
MRRHPKVKWVEIADKLMSFNWSSLFSDKEKCSKDGTKLVASFRLRLGDTRLQLSPGNHKWYYIKVGKDTKHAIQLPEETQMKVWDKLNARFR